MAPLLTEEEAALDPYAILALSTSATEKDIGRAYRQLSLKYHPDRSSAPDAPAKFREISLALDILKDVAKRQYVDGKLEGERRRKEKYAELDKKRKVMVDALNQREEEAKKAKVEAVQRRKQAAEEEEIKEAGRRMLVEAQKRAAAAAYASASQSSRAEAGPSRSNGQNGTADAQPPISPEDLTIILQFPSTSILPSTPPTLQPLLEGRYGPITHLIISEPPDTNGDTGKKKKKKGRKAVVEFKQGNWGGCWACWKDHMDGAEGRRLEDGVKARWAKGETPEWVAWADRQRQIPGSGDGGPGGGVDNGMAPAPRAPAFGSAPNLSTTSMADLMAEHAGRKEQKKKEEEFENMTLFRMRQAERDRLAEQIRLEEEEG